MTRPAAVALSLLALLAASCSSPWQEHQKQLAEAEHSGDWDQALNETKWLIDNAMAYGPQAQRDPAAEADRYLMLADFATHAGKTSQAIEALREALMLD